MKLILRWFALAVVVPLLAGWFHVDPLYRAARSLTKAPAVAQVSAQTSDPGHGAFCSDPAGPSVFLGRDVPELGTYPAFRDWCEERGGETGWKV